MKRDITRDHLIQAITPLNIIDITLVDNYSNSELQDLIKQHLNLQVAEFATNGKADHLLKMVMKDALRINEAEEKYEVCSKFQDAIIDLEIKELLKN